ncbi:S-adenosylhomocysteine hydrolase [Vibrio phage vB_VruC_PG21]|uniref:S-adenosylhomocysteine hydrolase n=1 Tax=Vibrio phage vB_VruC_PG21 TaxID=2928757 RepID=A0AAE9GVC5_9VIRU|nr:DUF3653 domain-containing protein [Vibrio sp. CK2-1]MCF7355086.1 phage protein [Vibrio sp. CK2-1]UOL48298.1 S-adenosylhomocysteine hydrolase [Vibrio phage vB_VruC_PG21]
MKVDIKDTLHEFGMYKNQVKDLFLWHFDSDKEAGEYFGVTPQTVKNWKTKGNYPLSVVRLLLIIHRGYLPTRKEWADFKIRGDKLYTPAGRELSAYDLMELDIRVTNGDNVIEFRRKKKTWFKLRHKKKRAKQSPFNV